MTQREIAEKVYKDKSLTFWNLEPIKQNIFDYALAVHQAIQEEEVCSNCDSNETEDKTAPAYCLIHSIWGLFYSNIKMMEPDDGCIKYFTPKKEE